VYQNYSFYTVCIEIIVSIQCVLNLEPSFYLVCIKTIVSIQCVSNLEPSIYTMCTVY